MACSYAALALCLGAHIDNSVLEYSQKAVAQMPENRSVQLGQALVLMKLGRKLEASKIYCRYKTPVMLPVFWELSQLEGLCL